MADSEFELHKIIEVEDPSVMQSLIEMGVCRLEFHIIKNKKTDKFYKSVRLGGEYHVLKEVYN